jgi:hypothetical protein
MRTILSTSILFLLHGAIAPAHAQAQREQEKQPEKQQQQAKPAQQAKQPQQAKPTEQARPTQQQAKPAQQAKPVQQQAKQPQARPAQQPAKSPLQQAKPAQQAKSAQPTARHGRIPDDKFRGSGHTFHVNSSDFTGASRRFQYGGYSWALISPWPVGWLYTDSVYVDYMNGGYFLCDPVHPGVYLSINIG